MKKNSWKVILANTVLLAFGAHEKEEKNYICNSKKQFSCKAQSRCHKSSQCQVGNLFMHSDPILANQILRLDFVR